MPLSPSRDEADHEPITEGPTDGYFNRRQHPHDLYIETPASSSAADTETTPAAGEAGSSDSSPTRSQVIYTPTSTTLSGETTPLLERDESPPAYTEVPNAPEPATEKRGPSTLGSSNPASSGKREATGGVHDLGESGIPAPTAQRQCSRRRCATSNSSLKKQFLIWIGIVTALFLVAQLFPEGMDRTPRILKPSTCENDTCTLNSRRTVIDIGSGSISGKYTLKDYLSIRTTSGSISIQVDPQPADANNPKPAVFEAHAVSGSIKIDFPTRGSIPEREYHVTVHSQAGSVSGTFIHGRYTSLGTGSGTVSATILPYSANESSSLNTDTVSGQMTVILLSPYKDPGTVMGRLESSHRSTSGNMKLAYPQEWEGTVEGRTGCGSIKLRGRDLEVVQDNKGYVGRHVIAKKGKGDSKMRFDAVSGSITAQIGDL